MEILQGKHAKNFDEAALLVFREAGVGDMATDVVSFFVSSMDVNKLHAETEKGVGAAVRNRWGRNAQWREQQRFYVPLPRLEYQVRPIPRLIFTIQWFVVAIIIVEARGGSCAATLLGPVGKERKVTLPMVFLLALIDDDLARFGVLAKNRNFTTWEIPGAMEVVLSNDFVDRICKALSCKSVLDWLGDFGNQGRCLLPLVVGTLLGLQSIDTAGSTPPGERAYDQEEVIDILKSLGHSQADTDRAFARIMPSLRADLTTEVVLRLILKEIGRRNGNGV